MSTLTSLTTKKVSLSSCPAFSRVTSNEMPRSPSKPIESKPSSSSVMNPVLHKTMGSVAGSSEEVVRRRGSSLLVDPVADVLGREVETLDANTDGRVVVGRCGKGRTVRGVQQQAGSDRDRTRGSPNAA